MTNQQILARISSGMTQCFLEKLTVADLLEIADFLTNNKPIREDLEAKGVALAKMLTVSTIMHEINERGGL